MMPTCSTRNILAGLSLAALMVALPSLGGCETLTQTPGENANMIVRTTKTNLREVPDDVDTLLLLDRPSLLTDKPVPLRTEQ